MSCNAICPICDASLALSADTLANELLDCDDCAGELVVVSTAPLTLEEAPQVEEDWGE